MRDEAARAAEVQVRVAALVALAIVSCASASDGAPVSGECKDNASSCGDFKITECGIPDVNGCRIELYCYLEKCSSIAFSVEGWGTVCDATKDCEYTGGTCSPVAGRCGSQCQGCLAQQVCGGHRKLCSGRTNQKDCNARKDCFWSEGLSL